ncbi:UvrD-helicase domain-containing protein [Vulcaniibacterium gelatinicum]|uniref:UvrD-helicase domain-containing protein n=1 Tax=Vulcaniibacterium gelatinicum TaxID=2598725 RepID=UPI0011CA8247|nr:exodeoxyribonuclease V subunit beta [Vulcaniibacterium gelatinicum]
MSAVRDPWLDLPLTGLRLIEASAGTGKTYTLATLALRQIVERGLRPAQLLAVTFTRAATAELRARIRARLALAARLAAGDAPDAATEAAEVALCRAVLAARPDGESDAALARRLRRAVYEMDLAAICTIDGFCQRVLAEHVLDAAALPAPELLGSARELYLDVAADVWRGLAAEPGAAEVLAAEWPQGPEALAKDLPKLLRATALAPAPAPDAADPQPTLERAAAALREAFLRHGDAFRDQLEAAIRDDVLHRSSYQADLTARLWPALAQWCATGEAAAPIHSHFDRLLPRTLLAKTKKNHAGRTPHSPLCDAAAAWSEAMAARDTWLANRRIALLHRVRAEAARRLDALKRARRVQTFDDLLAQVHAALAGPRGEALAQALRAQYAAALVDEFQDTDPRQWAIFDRVFGGGSPAPALCLVGDPKQAIYRFRGGDVHTYLDAAARAERAPALVTNFRARPCVLDAVNALYARAGAAAFVDPRIGYEPLVPGGRVDDADFLHDGAPAPALRVRALPSRPDGKPWSADDSRALATSACVAEIVQLLADGRARLRRRCDDDGEGAYTPVQPGDIAVLVREHKEATRIRAALAAAGVPAVAAGKQSLFATDEALELLTVLEALQHPGHDGRLRAALATVLLGLDAAALAAFDAEPERLAHWQAEALAWRERWQRHGPLALVSDLCAQRAPALLALADGERRLTNTLQLGEELQAADARALGEAGLVDWLRRRIAEADPDDETQALRLESDAARVQIVTLHKSKGLEYPLVFLPYAGIGKDSTRHSARWCETRDGHGVVLQLAPDDAARQAEAREQQAEDARLLYVGLTRARHALWLCTGPLYRHDTTPLAPMLRGLDALAADSAGAIVLDTAPPPETPPQAPPPERPPQVAPARAPAGPRPRDWWVHSFSQLTRDAEPALAERGGEDEAEAPAPDEAQARFAGARFGVALHDALERTRFEAWRDWDEGPAPPGERALLIEALRARGYAEAELEAGVALLTTLVGRTLTTPLPEGARLCELPPSARRAELEFHFRLAPTAVEALLATLHAHGLLRGRTGFGAWRRLEGLMTGKIDLVYAHDGRYFLLDYKSNRLPDYGPDALAQAMAESEYDLQALLYTLALHRWLRFRLGAGYDYARDFGGVRYLFCRGLAPREPARPGVHAFVPAPALVEAVDALFAGAAAEVAA